jgi:hypothetical protein
MAIGPTAGSKMYIADPGVAPAFPGVGWTEIGEIASPGTFGRTYQTIVSQAVARRGDVKFKGTFNDGQQQLTLNMDPEDDGQTELRTALDSDADFNFMVELNDAAEQGVDKNSTIASKAKVMSFVYNIGSGPNGTVQSAVGLEIKSGSIVFTAAADNA